MPDLEQVSPPRRRWLRRTLGAIAGLLILLVVFHGPILRALVHTVAVRVAAQQNLRLQFRVEGGILGGIALRDVRATATGPSALRSLDAGLVRADYNLTGLVFHGLTNFIENVEVRDMNAVIDPAQAPPPRPRAIPRPNEKPGLPLIFPGRVEIDRVSVTVRGRPRDLVMRNFHLGLYPDREGKLSVEQLQIPHLHDWSEISATTSYAQKNLVLRNLVIDPENRLEDLRLNASRIGAGELAAELHGSLGGGEIASQAELAVRGENLQTDLKLNAKNISLGELGPYLGRAPGELEGQVQNAVIDLRGTIEQPASWEGSLSVNINGIREGKFAVQSAKFSAQAHAGRVTIEQAEIEAGSSRATLRGEIDLPKTLDGFGRAPGNFQLAVDAPDLKQPTSFLATPVTGTLQVNGTLQTGGGAATLQANARGNLLGFGGGAVKQMRAIISARKKLPSPNDAPFFAGLSATFRLETNELVYGDFAADQVTAEGKSDGAQVSLSDLSLKRNHNLLFVRGNYRLPSPNEKLEAQPAELTLNFRAPQLSDFWKSDAPNKVSGELQADANLQLRDGAASGAINVFGRDISAQKLIVRQFSAQSSLAGETVFLNDLTATLNEQDFIRAHGSASWRVPFDYRGAATVNLADLSAFEPLLATAGKKTPLAGSLVVDWQGEGNGADFKSKGDLNLKLTRGRFADLQDLQANVEAHYTPNELNVPIVFLGSNKLDFQASLTAKDATLEVSKIQMDQGTAKYATGYASLPFVWSNVGTPRAIFPPGGKVLLNFQSENFDLGKVFQDVGTKPPISGQLSMKLDAQGALENLQANLALQLQNLRATATAQLEPATVQLNLGLTNNQLKVDGKIQQAKIQPVQITGNVPLNFARIIAAKKIDGQTPLNLSVQMPRSSVNFVRQFVPALRDLDGSVALNLGVGGTVARPALRGAADMNINVARFENATLPALTNFKAQLDFRDQRLSLQRFGGELAGGPFTLNGQITLPKWTEPVLDLRLKANSVLVARNDSVTARVDADLKLQGPLASAAVTGEVLTTNSRFLKNIDIIPIGLPGRPAPQPPPSAPPLTFPNPPLRDWKFDVAIKSKDPFLIRGNLATGEARIDMKMGGNGLHPALQGQVRLTNFDATLPFSTLTVQYGFLYFDPDDPFNPRVELHGTSLIRDYTIHVYVYGTADAPEAVFSSEPPLPQEEIISLLATGTTREELTSNGNVLAGRAALILVKQLYRKIFKKNDEEPKSDTFFSRLDVTLGAVDPRTGEQTATATYKASKHIVLVGDLEVGGDFRGLVKYLVRFR